MPYSTLRFPTAVLLVVSVDFRATVLPDPVLYIATVNEMIDKCGWLSHTHTAHTRTPVVDNFSTSPSRGTWRELDFM